MYGMKFFRHRNQIFLVSKMGLYFTHPISLFLLLHVSKIIIQFLHKSEIFFFLWSLIKIHDSKLIAIPQVRLQEKNTSKYVKRYYDTYLTDKPRQLHNHHKT